MCMGHRLNIFGITQFPERPSQISKTHLKQHMFGHGFMSMVKITQQQVRHMFMKMVEVMNLHPIQRRRMKARQISEVVP